MKQFVAGVIFNEEGAVLLCKRAAYKKIAPNKWHLPGGAIEEGEDPAEAVIRELKEELDLDVTEAISTGVVLRHPGDTLEVQCFFVNVSNSPTIMNHENSEFKFVMLENVSEYLEAPVVENNRHAIETAFKLQHHKSE